MLFGTNAWEVNYNHPRGFFMVCCACGWNSQIKIGAPDKGHVIIKCKRDECGQVVEVINCEAKVTKPSKHITPTQANMSK